MLGAGPSARIKSASTASGRSVETWRGAEQHFLVRLAPSAIRTSTAARLATMSAEERQQWANVLARARADTDSLAFLAVSLDGERRPIAVANSDPATRLFLGDGEGDRQTPDAHARAEVLRDVRLFARPYPVGLLVAGVGPAVANDAYASPSVWQEFERDRYHGPRVIWGRENNLFLIGTMERIADASSAAAQREPGINRYRQELRGALDQVLAAVEASGFHSELWSYEVNADRVVPVRYGSGSDVQLWSTTDLVVQYERARLKK